MGKVIQTICITLTTILCILCAFVIGIWIIFDTETIYSKTCMVTEIDTENNLVTVSTASGLLFQFYGVEDYDVTDIVSVTFFTRFTPKNVKDDMVVSCRYSGFVELFSEMENELERGLE